MAKKALKVGQRVRARGKSSFTMGKGYVSHVLMEDDFFDYSVKLDGGATYDYCRHELTPLKQPSEVDGWTITEDAYFEASDKNSCHVGKEKMVGKLYCQEYSEALEGEAIAHVPLNVVIKALEVAGYKVVKR